MIRCQDVSGPVARSVSLQSWTYRALLALMTMTLAAAVLWSAPSAAKADKPVQFMRKVAAELIAASRSGSPSAMQSVIARYGAIDRIGLYSLGTYARRLSRSRRPGYYQGMTRFMARYAISQAKNYPVRSAVFHNRSFRDRSGYKVDSRVTFKDGSTYDVRWLVVYRSGAYKVRDAQVLGFWLTPFQRQLFNDYIEKNGGNVNALLAALGA